MMHLLYMCELARQVSQGGGTRVEVAARPQATNQLGGVIALSAQQMQRQRE